MRALNVALLGCGVVGGEVAGQLAGRGAELAARIGAPVRLAGVAVRNADLPRPGVPAHLVTTDAHALVSRPDIDVVIEAIGGIEPAQELIEAAFARGASVVSANKALIAAAGAQLHATAAVSGVDLYYEAAVGGAIPLLRPLRESLAGDRVNRVLGIVNGTTNFILDRMATLGVDYPQAVKEASHLGYAEADPTADVAGHDAAAKAAILAGIAFHTRVRSDQVHREGITGITPVDIEVARSLGYAVKFLAVCDRCPDGRSVQVRVHPAVLPESHPLARVRGADNAVLVDAEAAGRLMFAGPGAGGAPTASAVLGDLVTVCRNRIAGITGRVELPAARFAVRPMRQVWTRGLVRLDVADRPEVLTSAAGVLARHGVGVETVTRLRHVGGHRLVLTTEPARDAALTTATEALRGLDQVTGEVAMLRIEEPDLATG